MATTIRWHWVILWIGLFPQLASAVSNARDDVSLRLFRGLLESSEGKNVIFSPYSIRQALGLAAAGARGKTQKQLGEFPKPWTAKKNPSSKFLVANRLWIQRTYPVLEKFLTMSDETFGVRPWMVDFTKAPDFLKSRVNGWVDEMTTGKVRTIISEDSIDSSMRMMLTSALYFKGDWATPFDRTGSHEENFTLASGEDVPAPFLQVTGSFKTYKNREVQILELPYVDGELAMLILLPTSKFGLKSLENSLKPETLEQWVAGLAPTALSVDIPAFNFNSTYELSGVLKDQGMDEPFLADVADFSAMTGKKDLFLSRVFHKAFISVTETGTEGGASTLVHARAGSRSPASAQFTFKANHPFVFAVTDLKPRRTIFLLGKVAIPASTATP